MSTDLNREQKRQLRKMGALNEQGAPTRTPRTATPRRPDEERVGLIQYFREARAEMRKVVWPDWDEVRRYSIVVLVTVLVFVVYVGGLDALLGVFSSWLYRS